MKTTYYFSITALTFFLGLMMTSCSSEDQDLTTPNAIRENVQSGIWIITSFIDSEKDETNHFTGYQFTFDASGTLIASNGNNRYEGTWSITESNSNDGSTEDMDFNINFNLANDFEDLNDDWDFISLSANKMELIDISGGNGGTDYLTFEKI